MTTSNMNPKVDEYLNRTSKWREEFVQLRKIILECQLTEELKWGVPCYTYQKGNVILIHGFKECCALLFIKGALLKDPQGILIQQTENVQAGRQIRFTNVQAIQAMESTIKKYIYEAVEIEKAGLEINFTKNTELVITEELNNEFSKNPALKIAFEALTPGRQRAYLLYFSDPKQAKTRASRVEKWIPQILSGKGLND